MKLKLKQTADGSLTLFQPDLNEQYHSLNGAVTESKHVYLEMGFQFHPSPNPTVCEVGFGTGLNALVTAWQAERTGRIVNYVTLENFPLDMMLVKKLNYDLFIPEPGRDFFLAMHKCAWNIPVQLSSNFILYKIKSDVTASDWKLPVKSDIVYFDAFGPDKQPEMWTQKIFSNLYEQVLTGGVLVTYSAKGEIRRRLNAAGFETKKLPGPPGKKEMLRAIK